MPHVERIDAHRAKLRRRDILARTGPADVNRDGVVNILDLVLIAQELGTGNQEADVNGDGVVNVFDLVAVADAI